jgi:5'-phosphate synthase pdxT subunit
VKVGVLALQGDVREHCLAIAAAGAEPVEVKQPEELAGVSAVVLPGGESTTLSMLLDSSGLRPVLGRLLEEGLPAFGTCAGMILLAREVKGGRPDQRGFATLDVTVRRNGFGRQRESFESQLTVAGLAEPVPAVFIRAPVVERVGADVEVLAVLADPGGGASPVLCRQGNQLVASFHPELSGDARIHEMFLSLVG